MLQTLNNNYQSFGGSIELPTESSMNIEADIVVPEADIEVLHNHLDVFCKTWKTDTYFKAPTTCWTKKHHHNAMYSSMQKKVRNQKKHLSPVTCLQKWVLKTTVKCWSIKTLDNNSETQTSNLCDSRGINLRWQGGKS